MLELKKIKAIPGVCDVCGEHTKIKRLPDGMRRELGRRIKRFVSLCAECKIEDGASRVVLVSWEYVHPAYKHDD